MKTQWTLDELRKAVQVAEEQFERGEFAEVKTEEELHDFFEGVKARGRKRLEQMKKNRHSNP